MHKKEGLGPLPGDEKPYLGWKILKDEVWSEREVLGGEEAIGIKKDREKWDLNRVDPIYRSLVILDRSRGVERCRALKGSTNADIEQVSIAKRSSMDWGAIEETETFSMDRGAIKKLSRLR